MQVTAGLDEYCRSGGWCPVRAVLSNEGADIEGELRVVARSASGDTESDVYTRRVVLPTHSRKAYFLYLPSPDVPASTHLKVQLRAGDEVLSSERAAVTWLSLEDRLYGVISSNPSALNFLSSVAPAGEEAKVAHLSLEALPPDPLGWEGLDVLILNNVDTSALSSEQRQALEMWVTHGGHLIVGGGAGAARTVAGLAAPSTGSEPDLLPVAVEGFAAGGTRSVNELWALGEWLGATTVAGPYAVAKAVLRDGQALIEQEDLILLARRTHGAGQVDFVAFDAGVNPFTRWNDNVHLWEFIVGMESTGPQRLAIYNGYNAQEAINTIPGLELPSALQILAFMLFYTLLVGPVNYLVLRRLDRRELAWLTIPALIVGFTVCAYLTGFQIRGSMAIVHQLAVVYVPPLSQGPQAALPGRVNQVVGLFSPRRMNYDVRVAGAGVREIPGVYHGGLADHPLHIIKEAEGLIVTGLRVDVGGIRPFLAEGYADVPGVEADLRLVKGKTGVPELEGTVRNGEMLLKDAVLIAGSDEQRLGDLQPGAVAQVHITLGSPLSPSEDTSERILGPGNYWGDRELYRRYQLLQTLFPYNGPRLKPGAYLIGWAEEAPLPVEVVDRPFSTAETALYIYGLPVKGLETGTAVTISPDLITRQVEETIGYVDVWPYGFHMEPEAAIVFRFTVWPGVMVQQVDELVLDLQSRGYGSTPHPPIVSLWNQKSNRWEELDVGWGRHSIPNAADYFLPSGVVRLRLETGAGWSADVESLTITIRGQR